MMPGARRGRSSSSCGEVLRPCVGGSPAQDPHPSAQSPCGRRLGVPWQRWQSALCISAEPCLPTGPQIKVRSTVSRLGGLGRALIWMFGFLSPPSPALWKGVLFLLARWRSGSSCLLFCRASRSPGGSSWEGPGSRRHCADLAPGAPWGTPGQDGVCLLVRSKITAGISPADLG